MTDEEQGRMLLDQLEERVGPELVASAFGVWLARGHRSRPRLMWARPDSPARAPHYLAFVRGLDCVACGAPAPVDPHHFGPRGIAQKTDDYRVVPLCRRCHDAAHADCNGEWVRGEIINTLVRYMRIVEQT